LNAVDTYQFKGIAVRGTLDGDGMAWFIARDVGSALGHSNIRKLAARLDADEKRAVTIGDTPGGPQVMTMVNEPGVYKMLMWSRIPAAKEFQRWLAHEVIPSIRRTGGYPSGESQLRGVVQDLVGMVRELGGLVRDILKKEPAQFPPVQTQPLQLQPGTVRPARELETAKQVEDIPPLTRRAELVDYVRGFARQTNIPYAECWGFLYKQFCYRYHFALGPLVKEMDVERLDVIERKGLMDAIYRLALEVLPL